MGRKVRLERFKAEKQCYPRLLAHFGNEGKGTSRAKEGEQFLEAKNICWPIANKEIETSVLNCIQLNSTTNPIYP